MTVIRYPVLNKSLNFISEDEVFLDSSFILTAIVDAVNQNNLHQYARNLLKLIKKQNARLYVSPTVFSEAVDNVMAILFGNDLILYANKEHSRSKYIDYDLAKKCFENTHIMNDEDLMHLKDGEYKRIEFKSYINKFTKNRRRKTWLKKYYKPSYSKIERFLWVYQIKTLSSIDEDTNRTISILPAMETMNIRSHDALHYSTAVYHGCNYFLTADTDFRNNLFDELITIVLITNRKQ